VTFQGSETGADLTWIDLFTLDEDVREGWNYQTWGEDQPRFRFYRFRGSEKDSCLFTEIKASGLEIVAP
jgi:hypothetical protein